MKYRPSLSILIFVLSAFLIENTLFVLLDFAARQSQRFHGPVLHIHAKAGSPGAAPMASGKAGV